MPFLQKNGKWRASKMINGARKTKIFKSKAEAKKWEAQQTEELWQPEEQPTPTDSVIDFLTAYLDSQKEKVSEKNFNEKKLSFRRALHVIKPEQDVTKVTPEQAELVMRYVAREVSGYAANKTRKNLSAAWSWGRRLYGLEKNPWKDAEKMPADSKPRYVPPEGDFWKVYDACEDPRDKTLLLFLLHTGARIQEAFRLQWSDVDFDRQQVRLGTRKTASGGMEYAWIPMTSELMTALNQHKRRSSSLNVFVSKKDGLQYTHRNKFMRRLCLRANVIPFGYHAIRHLTATILAHSGLDLPSIQAILRHHNPTTTARYIQSLGVQQNKIEAVFATKKRGAKVVTFDAPEAAVK